MGQLATNDPDRMDKRQLIRIGVGLDGGVVHQAANGEVRQEEAITFLADQVGGLTAQDHLGAAQMRLQFVQRGFDLPAFVIQRGELRGRRGHRVLDRRDQPVERFRLGDAEGNV